MVHRQALHESGGFLDERLVVADLRARERRDQRARFPDAEGSAKLADRRVVD